ncbi:MAG: TIGR03545 family protein [Colwellia sp.]|nr:TIGR03545 family protein [Colwellia sp.]
MRRLFRWQGLVAFSILVALVAVFFYIFAENLIKRGIEKSASWSLGAEVNVEKVTLTYSPLSISIDNVQATDAKNPSKNLLSFSRARVDLEFWQYLFGKIIINDLIIEGLEFNQKRLKQGEVYLVQDQNDEVLVKDRESLLPALGVSFPDAKTLLADSELITVKQAQVLKQSYLDEGNKLKALKMKLPNKVKLKSYQKRLKDLAKTKVKNIDDIAQITKQFEQIQKEFEADKKVVEQAKTQLMKSKKIMSEQVKLMKDAPSKDWQNIEKKYQLDQVDAEDFADILFGKQAREHYRTIELIVNKVKPYLDKNKIEQDNEINKAVKQSSKGQFIYFFEEQPLPSFLVKNSHISMRVPQGDFSVSIKELNSQHWLRDKPTRVTFSSNNLNKSGSFVFDSEFSFTKEQLFSASGTWSLDNFPVENINFRESKKLNLTLMKGLVFGEGQLMIEGNLISNVNNVKLSQMSYQGEASSHLGNILIDTFKSLDDLSIGIKVSGGIDEPDYVITSDLDKVLKNAFTQQISKKLSQFTSTIQTGLNNKLKSSLEINNQQIKELIDIENLFTDTDKVLDELLHSDVVKQQEEKLKNMLQDTIEDKLKEKFGKFLGG